MYNEGIQFGMEGPTMSGTWINPATGHKFTVRDSYFEDNNYKVITTEGQVLDYNIIQNYVQCNDDKGNAIEPPKDMLKPQTQDIPKEVADMMEVDPDDEIPGVTTAPKTSLGNIAQPSSQRQAITAQSEENEDMLMVRRVLRKHPIPQLNICFNWEIPSRQLDTLVNVLGVDAETIAQYYIGQLNMSEVFDKIKSDLTTYINAILTSDVEEINIPFLQTRDLDKVAPERLETTLTATTLELQEPPKPSKTSKKGGVKKDPSKIRYKKNGSN